MEDNQMIDIVQSQMQRLQHSQLSARIDAMLENDNTLQPLIHKGISSRHLELVNEPPQDAALVLSNLLVADEDEIQEANEESPLEEEEYLDMDKFQQLVLEMNFQDLDPNKLLQYLEFLESQGLHIPWEDGERKKYEGFFLALLVNDSKFLGSFAYRPALQRVVSNFVKYFKQDYEEKLNETENMLNENPYLLLLCSFSADLCSVIEMNGLADELATTIDEIPLENIPIILRAITNIIPRCPTILDKMITYDLISQIMDKLNLDDEDSSNLAPFLQLTLAARATGRAPSECLDSDSAGRLLTHLSMKVQNFEDLVILSTKLRLRASPVTFLIAGSPLDITERYFNQNQKIISAKLTKEQFLEYYFFAEIFLEFLKMNISDAVKSYRRKKNMKNSVAPHSQEQLLKTAMDLFALYNFQPSISENFLTCLSNRMTKSLIPWTFENILTHEILLNLAGPFGDKVYLTDDSANKTPTAHPQTDVLTKLQLLYLKIITVLQKNNEGLGLKQCKIIIDGVWMVRRATSHIQGVSQAAYLSKGLNKYVEKAAQWINPKLEELEKNNLNVIEGIATCYDMTEVIDFRISQAYKQKLSNSSSGSSAQSKYTTTESMILKATDSWTQPIYLAIMSNNEDKMIEKFINSKVSEIEELADQMTDATAKSSFHEALSLLDFMNLSLHWIRKKNSITSSDRSKINKILGAFGKMLISTPAFIEVNRNHQLFLILERLALAFHYSASSRILSITNRVLFLLKCLVSSDPTLSGSEIDLPAMGIANISKSNKNKKSLENVPYKIDPEKLTIMKSSLDEETTQNLVDFLREIIQKKEKSAFLNFFAAKIIDWLFISVESFPALQLQLMETLFGNALEGKFPKELHFIPPYYLISYSGTWLDRPNAFKAYVGLTIREKLFIDRPIRLRLRALLPKGFPLAALEFGTNDERLLFARLICEESPKKLRNKLLLYLVDLAPKIADKKRPFLSTIRVLEELLGGGEDFREGLLSLGPKEKQEHEQDEDTNYQDPTKDKFCINLATRVLSETSIMKRMQKLYTRDKINLEKVILILLRIADKFELMETLELPDEIIAGALASNESEFISLDAYTSIETNLSYSDMTNSSPCSNMTGYILKYLSYKPDQLEKHMNAFQNFLPRIKRFLDSQLFFVRPSQRAVPSQIEPCVQAIHSICVSEIMKEKEFNSSFLNVEFTVEYLLKFLFNHIDNNPNIELVQLNNLSSYYNNFQMITTPIQLRANRRLLLCLIILLNQYVSFYNSSLNNRIVSALHLVTDKRTFSMLREFIWTVICNLFEINPENGEVLLSEENEDEEDPPIEESLKEDKGEKQDDFMDDVINDRNMQRFAKMTKTDPSFNMYLDYYYLVDYEFDFSESLHFAEEEENDRDTKYDNLNKMLLKTHSSMSRVTELLSPKLFNKAITPLVLNNISRASLRLAHILKHKPSLMSKKANLISKMLDGYKTILDHHFEDIHKRPKLEKLILDNLSKMRKAYPVKNNNLAGVFINILNSQPAFRISSHVDKFAYMGLFNAYCDAKKKLSKLVLNPSTADFEVKKNPRVFSNIPDFTNDLIRDSILLIGYDLPIEREIVLLGFLSKLARTKPDLCFSKKMVPPERILKRIFILGGKLMKTATGDSELTEEEAILVKKRLRLGKLGLRWLRVALDDGQEIIPSKGNNPNNENNIPGNQIGDPFWTLNYLSFKYRESINAQYNTLTAHYEPLNLDASNVYDVHPMTSKNKLTESQLGQAFKKTPTVYGNTDFGLDMGSDYPLTEEVFDASEWLAVQTKLYLEKNTPLIEKLTSNVGLRILRKICSYNYGLIKLMRKSHRSQLKSLLMESFYIIFNPSLKIAAQGEPKIRVGNNEEVDKEVQIHHLRHTAAQNIILLHLIKLCRNKYDELRIVKHRDFASKILEPLQDDESLNGLTFIKMEFSADDVSSEVALYTSRTTESMIEKCLSFFMYMCKNKLYLTKEIKEEVFRIIDRNKATVVCSPFQREVFKKLAVEFNGAEMSFYLDVKSQSSPPEALPEGLNRRQQNILYVQKVMKNIGSLLETQEELDDKQTRFLNFALLALKHHLLKGVDPELFSGMGMTKLIFQYILSDKINAQFRLAFLEVIYEYLQMTREQAQLDLESISAFLKFYPNLEDVNEEEPGFAKKYFRTCRLILRIFPFEDNEMHNELSAGLQEEVFINTEAYEKVHIDNLNLLAKVLLVDQGEKQNGETPNLTNYATKKMEERIKTIKPEVEGVALQETIYEFCKENHRKFNIREIGLLLELLMLTEQQGIFLRNPKLNALMGYLKLKTDKQKSPDILYCIDSLLKCTKLSPNFQEYLYHLNFELFFKLSLRRFSTKPEILKPLIYLFLQYTFALEENKFEMSDSTKILIKQSKAYFTELKDEESALLCIKALVNCSLLKANAKAIVTSGLLQESLIVVNQNNNSEISSASVALLFNIVFAFDKGEIKIADFVNSKVISLLHNILQKASLEKNNGLVSEILDLLNAFCQHEYLNFFNSSMIYNLRFTLDNSGSHSPTVLKLLSLLRALSMCKSARVRKLIKLTFGPRRLMGLLTPKSGKKLHLVVKQIICALLEMDKWGPETLANEGMPENIMHTFSLQDSFSVMAINLKIAKLSVESKNAAFYMQSNCIPILAHMSGGISLQEKSDKADQNPEESHLVTKDKSEYKVYPSQIVMTSMDILLILEEQLGSVEELNPVFHFSDIEQLSRMIDTFVAKPKYLELTIKLLAHVLNNDPGAVKRAPDHLVTLLKDVLKSKESPSKREFLDTVYSALSKLEMTSGKGDKYELKNDKMALTYDDKLFLDAGGICMAIIDGRLIQKCGIRFDFVEGAVCISCEKLPINPPKMISSGEIIIRANHLDRTRTASHIDLQRVEKFFKSMFERSPRPERVLPMSGKVKSNDTLQVVTFDLLFDNDFHCKKWNGLLNKIIENSEAGMV